MQSMSTHQSTMSEGDVDRGGVDIPEPKLESQTSLPDQLMIRSKSLSTRASFTRQKNTLEQCYWESVRRKPKSIKEKIKPKTKIKPRYFTSAEGVNEGNKKDLMAEPSPYLYPKDLEEFAHRVMTKAWRNEVRMCDLRKKCSQKPSQRVRQQQDLLNRLYVEEPKIGVSKTILDTAPEYFKIIEGRPIADRMDIRTYIDTVRDTLRTKIVTGYREDDIMLLEENLILEQKIIDSIGENLKGYISTFEEFLYRDHTSSMAMLKESEEVAMQAYEANQTYKLVAKKYSAARSALFNSEEKWQDYQMYEQFLFIVSPFSWRKQHSDVMDEDLVERSNVIEDQLYGKQDKGMNDISIEDLMKKFDNVVNLKDPNMYFHDPEQLLDVFRFMEMQNLNSLLHSEELALPLEQVKEGMRNAEEMFDLEISHLTDIINKLEGGISWEEERAKYLEDLAHKLIQNEFKKLVMDDEVLNLHVFVEEVYETRIGPNDANLEIDNMMKAIEQRYRHELLSLDKTPAEQVALLESGCYAEQMMVMRLAEKAAKQYAELEQLTHRLNRAFAPPYQKHQQRELKFRSPPMEQYRAPPPQPRQLTKAEEEYLEFFTDYCKFTDNSKDYGINTKK